MKISKEKKIQVIAKIPVDSLIMDCKVPLQKAISIQRTIFPMFQCLGMGRYSAGYEKRNVSLNLGTKYNGKKL